jgi:hypothetical protein
VGSGSKKYLPPNEDNIYFVALMGAIPGCLGAFVVVAMYSHRMLTLGAVVAAMIATAGDESFVMLALIPKHAIMLMILLFFTGLIVGFLTDLFSGQYKSRTEEMKQQNINQIYKGLMI